MALIKFAGTVQVPKVVIIACAVVNVATLFQLPDMFVTSGNDSKHKVGSKHFSDQALDFRTKHLSDEQKTLLHRNVIIRLGPAYDVLLEDRGGPDEHLHVEYDPK